MKGHVRRRGNSWELRAYVGLDPTTGRAKYMTRTFRGETRSRRSVGSVRDRGLRRRTWGKDTTLSELIRRWIDLVREDLSPSMVRGYERIIRCYIDPDIGRVSLAKLRTDQLDRFYSEVTRTAGARMAARSRRRRSDRPMPSSGEHSIRQCAGAGLQQIRHR